MVIFPFTAEPNFWYEVKLYGPTKSQLAHYLLEH